MQGCVFLSGRWCHTVTAEHVWQHGTDMYIMQHSMQYTSTACSTAAHLELEEQEHLCPATGPEQVLLSGKVDVLPGKGESSRSNAGGTETAASAQHDGTRARCWMSEVMPVVTGATVKGRLATHAQRHSHSSSTLDAGV